MTHIKCTWGKSQQGFEQCLERVRHRMLLEVNSPIVCVIFYSVVWQQLWSVLPPTLLKAPGECDSLRQAGVHLWVKHAGQRNRGRTGACRHGDRDIRGVEGWWGFPCKLTLRPGQLTDAHPHTSQSHIMTTHIHTSFTGLEVETGKQAEGRKLFYSASHSKSEPWLQPVRYPTAATETQRGKKKI